MMKFTSVVAVAVMTASAFSGSVQAQNLRNVQAPAEFPPASYRGAQYVDSQGCVFIRAGIDGNVTWVPRVNRQRRIICGQQPSLSAQAAQSARTTPRATATANTVEQITLPQAAQPAAPTVAAATTPVPKPAAPVARVAKAPAAQPAGKPAPRQVARVVQPKPAAPKTAQRVVVQRPAPTQAPTVVAAPKVAKAPTRTVAATNQRVVSSQTRVVPRHVFDSRQEEGVFPIPDGYRSVWQDDRLNTRRAEQSLEGIARTRLVWTQTVPRRLIERNTGRDVTTKVALVYPFTDAATQERELGTVTLVRRDGQLQKRIVRNKAKARAPTVSTSTAPAPVVKQATRAAPKPKASGKGRYVQVGTYGQPSNAQAAAQRIMRAGLPARLGKVTRGSKTYQVVLAGPFTSSTDLNNGLRTSRAVGFDDAFVR
ncbi:SPOR domain-containing protein [Tateyamaria sp.]|uniref:SPOR domain-containing protein n=3 Tax=Tateyamaria sp. TaxID=1929288 RepID=UPI00329DDD0C